MLPDRVLQGKTPDVYFSGQKQVRRTFLRRALNLSGCPARLQT